MEAHKLKSYLILLHRLKKKDEKLFFKLHSALKDKDPEIRQLVIQRIQSIGMTQYLKNLLEKNHPDRNALA